LRRNLLKIGAGFVRKVGKLLDLRRKAPAGGRRAGAAAGTAGERRVFFGIRRTKMKNREKSSFLRVINRGKFVREREARAVSILGKSKKEPAEAGQEPRAQPAVPVRQAPVAEGLTAEEAAQRCAAGLDNRPVGSPTKSEARIVRENVFTFFNLVFAVLAICLLAVGSFGNMAFALIALCNTAIGIVQQIRSKRTVDQLTLLAQQQVPCVRGGKTETIPADRLVRDDIVAFSAGDQICADALVREGELQVNESLITGEADLIPKKPGDTLHSGSFAVSGRCHAQLTRVGADSFAGRLTLEAKRNVTVVKSEMMRSLDGLIRVIGIVLVPMGVILFVRQYTVLGLTLRDSVEATVAALIGMIPEGLYLLTSVALSVSMVRLAQGKTLIHDMSAIETLARVDVLCVDKTGTITSPQMEVREVVELDAAAFPQADIADALGAFSRALEPDNDTARAVAEHFPNGPFWPAVSTVPFTSETKWSAVNFAERGAYVLGAPEFVLGADAAPLRPQIKHYAEQGCRVLVLACCDRAEPGRLEGLLLPMALLVLENPVRPGAAEDLCLLCLPGRGREGHLRGRPRHRLRRGRSGRHRRRRGVGGRPGAENRPGLQPGGPALHRLRPGGPQPEAQAGAGAAAGGPHRGHDRRRRQRRAGAEGRGLRHRHGLRRGRRLPGGAAGAAGLQLRLAAPGGGGGPPGYQQHPAGLVPLPGEEHPLVFPGHHLPSLPTFPYPLVPNQLTLLSAS
jgi:hypothetical protein